MMAIEFQSKQGDNIRQGGNEVELWLWNSSKQAKREQNYAVLNRDNEDRMIFLLTCLKHLILFPTHIYYKRCTVMVHQIMLLSIFGTIFK